MEGNSRFKIDWASLIEGNLPFLLWFKGDLYLEGRFNGRFFALRVWGAYIWRGLFSEFYGTFTDRVSVLVVFMSFLF